MHEHKKINIKNDFELLCLAIIMGVVYLCYGPVSHMAALRGINTAPFLATPLDWMIPYQPFWITFYSLAFVIPPLVLIALRIHFGKNNIEILFRACYTLILMILFSYAIFVIAPCSVIEMFHLPKQIWLNELFDEMVRIQFVGEAPFNDNPSLHVATGWLLFRYVNLYFKTPQRVIFFIWFVGMTIGTLTLKVHIIENDVAGIIVAELFYYYIFLRQSISFSNYWFKFSYLTRIITYVVITIMISAFFYWFVHTMGTLTDVTIKNNLYLKMFL